MGVRTETDHRNRGGPQVVLVVGLPRLQEADGAPVRLLRGRGPGPREGELLTLGSPPDGRTVDLSGPPTLGPPYQFQWYGYGDS